MTRDLNYIIVILFFCGFLAFGWIGFLASDDMMYTSAAESWLTSFPYLGDNHWALRQPLVISTAFSYLIFGVNEYSLALTTSSYFLAIVLLTYYYFKRIKNSNLALLASVSLITIPLFTIQSTYSGCDLVELFFILCSILLFHHASQENKVSLLFISGLMAGFAWLTRETSASLPILYAGLFLYGYGNRKNYIWLAVGFISVAVTEITIYYLVENDFLYRVWIDLDQGKSTGKTLKVPGTGNIEINKIFNPILALLINQEFMLLFTFFFPASIWLFTTKDSNQGYHSLLILFFWLSVTWFVIIGYGLGVRSLPRYYSVTSYAALVIVIAWMYSLFHKNKIVSVILFTLFFSANFIGLYVENKQPIFGERVLKQWLVNNLDKEIYTDPITRSSAGFLLRTAGLEHRVHSGRPNGQTAYYLFNPNRVFQENRVSGYVEENKPLTHWQSTEVIKPERKWSGILIEWIGLEQLIPKAIVKKLNYPADAITIYRIN